MGYITSYSDLFSDPEQFLTWNLNMGSGSSCSEVDILLLSVDLNSKTVEPQHNLVLIQPSKLRGIKFVVVIEVKPLNKEALQAETGLPVDHNILAAARPELMDENSQGIILNLTFLLLQVLIRTTATMSDTEGTERGNLHNANTDSGTDPVTRRSERQARSKNKKMKWQKR